MSAFDLSTARGRLATYLHYFWYDHAYLRLAFSNAHRISDELVRANQPWPFQVKAWRDRGIRTIVNLRDGVDAHHTLEQRPATSTASSWSTSSSGRARRRAASRCWAPGAVRGAWNTRR